MSADEKFFRTIAKQAAPPFDQDTFFRDASFAKILDHGPTKLADDGTATPLTTPGVKPPKIEAPGGPVDMFQQSGKPKKAPNNPSGFHGASGASEEGSGFNPLK